MSYNDRPGEVFYIFITGYIVIKLNSEAVSIYVRGLLLKWYMAGLLLNIQVEERALRQWHPPSRDGGCRILYIRFRRKQVNRQQHNGGGRNQKASI